MDLYIYYKVNTSNAANLQQKILALQADLYRDWQIQTSLKQRTEVSQSTDKLQTWMEVYICIPEGFITALQSACDASNIQALIEGDRHCEFFVDIDTCA